MLFQSPSRWGRCCIHVKGLPRLHFELFQSPSRWGRCCIAPDLTYWGMVAAVFQSPSRWGRCCIRTGPSTPLLVPYKVSVPFSMGTVLHRRCRMDDCECYICFSPLLDGDGVASSASATPWRRSTSVSVPFSMGTVLHLCSVWVPHVVQSFQSPSRWGRCCI